MSWLIPPDALAIATIWQEARGERLYEGRVAVGEVIRNRIRRRYSSDGTVAGTVLRPYQFSGWNTDDPNRIKSMLLNMEDPLVEECARAWHESIQTELTKGAVLYCNLKIIKRPVWAKPERLLVDIGNHSFFAD